MTSREKGKAYALRNVNDFRACFLFFFQRFGISSRSLKRSLERGTLIMRKEEAAYKILKKKKSMCLESTSLLAGIIASA